MPAFDAELTLAGRFLVSNPDAGDFIGLFEDAGVGGIPDEQMVW